LFSLEDCANHNIPFLYSYIKDVRKMQKIVSEIWYYLQVGADIGQGYFGDEDGGVMSAFYFFIGLGLYPLNPLSGEFVITAPRFPFCEIDLPNGRFIINAPLASRENCCVKSVKLNGELHKGITINYEEIKNGGYLELELEKY
jgi:putative alpha-1,2-mannosidase